MDLNTLPVAYISIIEIVCHIKRKKESVEQNLDVHKYIVQNKIGFAF